MIEAPLMRISHITKSTKQRGKATKDRRYYASLAIPVNVKRNKMEYIFAIFEAVQTADGVNQNTSVHTAGIHLTLNNKIVKPFIDEVAKAKGLIDAGVLDKLISDAFLDAVIKPLDAVVAPGTGRTWMDALGMVGQRFGDELSYIPGAAADGEGIDFKKTGNDLMVVGGIIGSIGTLMAYAGPEAVVGAIGFGSVAAVAAAIPVVVVIGATTFIVGGVMYGVARATGDKEYPQYSELTPPQVKRTLVLMASLMGDRFVASYLRRNLGVIGGSVDAPEKQQNGPFFFGWMRLDAWIMALLRETLEMKSGAPVSTPTGETQASHPAVDPYGRWVRDPLWDPYLVQAALESANDRAAMVNSMASRIRPVKP